MKGQRDGQTADGVPGRPDPDPRLAHAAQPSASLSIPRFVHRAHLAHFILLSITRQADIATEPLPDDPALLEPAAADGAGEHEREDEVERAEADGSGVGVREPPGELRESGEGGFRSSNERCRARERTYNGVGHVGVVALELDGDGRQARHDEQR